MPAIESAGGRFLARSNPAKTYEAGMNERVVLVEFPSLDKAIACHDSPGYKEALNAIEETSPGWKRSRHWAPGMSSATCASWKAQFSFLSPLCEWVTLVGYGSVTLRLDERLEQRREQGEKVYEAGSGRRGRPVHAQRGPPLVRFAGVPGGIDARFLALSRP